MKKLVFQVSVLVRKKGEHRLLPSDSRHDIVIVGDFVVKNRFGKMGMTANKLGLPLL